MKTQARLRAFTLIELLVVMLIIGILAAIFLPILSKTKFFSQRSACLSNMRQLGIAFQLYAGEHNTELPGRIATGDKWPKLLYEYAKSTKVFTAPGIDSTAPDDPQLLSSAQNNTSFIMNGYNDLVDGIPDPDFRVRIINIPSPSQTLLLGTSKVKDSNFYMDMKEGHIGNHYTALNTKAYGDGSDYVFADGSARFINEKEYKPELWLTNKDYVVPPLPAN